MILIDQEVQRLYGTSGEESTLQTSRLTNYQYRQICHRIRPEIEVYQNRLYEKRIHPYVETFIGHVQKEIGKN
jgi:hypothetical protein